MREPDDPGRSYDAVAHEYARRLVRELEDKPFDRALLDRFAALIRPGGTVADIGCGPGHVGRYLHEHGVTTCGVDLSKQMVEQARRLHPGMVFQQGDMRDLPASDGAWAGLVAFYAVIHIPPEQVASTLVEFARVLEPGAPLLVSFHIGDVVVHLDEWWEQRVNLDFFFFRPDRMQAWLAQAGFDVQEVIERDPYPPEIEHQSRRCYVIARNPRPKSTPERPAERRSGRQP